MWPFNRSKDPLIELAKTIVRAALYSADTFRPMLEGREEADRKARWWAIVCEYVVVFAHVADRTAFRLYGPGGRDELIDRLAPALVQPLVETVFRDWPDEMKSTFVDGFYLTANEAQVEYAASKELLTENSRQFFTGDSIVSKMARRVADAYGSEDNPEVRMVAFEAFAKQYRSLNLEPLVRKAAAQSERQSR